jgi:hypothetical protein
MLQVAQSAMHDSLAVGGVSVAEVVLPYQGDPQASLRCIEGDPGAVDSGAYDRDVVFASFEALRSALKKRRIHAGLPGRLRVQGTSPAQIRAIQPQTAESKPSDARNWRASESEISHVEVT